MFVGCRMRANVGWAQALHRLIIGIFPGVTQQISHGAHRDLSDARSQELMRSLLALLGAAGAGLFAIRNQRSEIETRAIFGVERSLSPISADRIGIRDRGEPFHLTNRPI